MKFYQYLLEHSDTFSEPELSQHDVVAYVKSALRLLLSVSHARVAMIQRIRDGRSHIVAGDVTSVLTHDVGEVTSTYDGRTLKITYPAISPPYTRMLDGWCRDNATHPRPLPPPVREGRWLIEVTSTFENVSKNDAEFITRVVTKSSKNIEPLRHIAQELQQLAAAYVPPPPQAVQRIVKVARTPARKPTS